MSRKAFNVYVELHIHAVTCPGVWLCQNGRVILQVSLLGTTIRTTDLPPIFPILYHEKFIFQKVFRPMRYLTDLHDRLSNEVFLVELIQVTSDGTEYLMSVFESSVLHLLYPSPCDRGLISGVDVDLLMERTDRFPGIIAPKIEVSTRTTIEEVLKNGKTAKDSLYLINPTTLSSKASPVKKRPRGKKVCHSLHSRTSKRQDSYCPTVRSPCNRCTPKRHPCMSRDYGNKDSPGNEVVKDSKLSTYGSKYKDCTRALLESSPPQPLTWESRLHDGPSCLSKSYRQMFQQHLETLSEEESSEKENNLQHVSGLGCKCKCYVKDHKSGKCSVCSTYQIYFPPPEHHKRLPEHTKVSSECHQLSNAINGASMNIKGPRKIHKCENSSTCPIKCDCCASKGKADKSTSTRGPQWSSSPNASRHIDHNEKIHPAHCNCPHISRFSNEIQNQMLHKSQGSSDFLNLPRTCTCARDLLNSSQNRSYERGRENILNKTNLDSRWADGGKEKPNMKHLDYSSTSSYSDQFYQSLEKFYRKLHERYKNKVPRENITA